MKTDGLGAPGTERRDWIIRLGVAFIASVITAIVGPFATYEQYPFLLRLLYWGGLILGMALPAFLIRIAISRYHSAPPLRQDTLSVLIMTVTLGPAVWLINLFIMGFNVAGPRALLEHMIVVALIGSVPMMIRAYLLMHIGEIRANEAANAAQMPMMTEGQAVFLRRLDPAKRGYVLRVSADDHQVEVWTDRGSSKLRLRFGDALEELLEFDGTRIHRSHWVAFDAIDAVVPDRRRHVVHLSCGKRLPVSQNGLRSLQDAGVAIQERAEPART